MISHAHTLDLRAMKLTGEFSGYVFPLDPDPAIQYYLSIHKRDDRRKSQVNDESHFHASSHTMQPCRILEWPLAIDAAKSPTATCVAEKRRLRGPLRKEDSEAPSPSQFRSKHPGSRHQNCVLALPSGSDALHPFPVSALVATVMLAIRRHPRQTRLCTSGSADTLKSRTAFL